MYRKRLIIGVAVLAICLAAVAIPAMAKTDQPGTAISPAIESAPAAAGKPSMTVYPAVLTGDNKKMNATILIAGLEPEQEFSILMSLGGVASDISFLLGEEEVTAQPKANEFGAFAGPINFGPDMWRRKLIGAEVQTITAVDAEGNVLATAPVQFVAPPPAEKK